MMLFRKCWRSLEGLGTESLSMFSTVIHYVTFFTNLYQQVSSVLTFSLGNQKRKIKLTFRWKTTCVDWPPSCPLLTSSRCPSSSKIKRNSRPRKSFRITQMTSEAQEWEADMNTGNTHTYAHSLTHSPKPITHTVTRLSFRENFLD